MNTIGLSGRVLAATLLTFTLSGCETNKQTTGTVVGAIAGGVIGHQIGGGSGNTIATIAGTILGGYLGGELGRQMDEKDRQQTAAALETTPTYETSSWTNPDTGNRYDVTPTRTFGDESEPCRDYTTDAWIDGQRETIVGTACRQPDGTWQARN